MEQDARRPAGGGPHLSPGEVLAGRYRVVSFLGEGAMGEVYEADDLELGEPVAIKILRADITRDDQVLQRFKREIQLARKVTHPNVSRVFDLVHHSGHPGHPGGTGGSARVFLTMELLRGETLEDRLARDGRLSAAEALPIIRQIAAALEAAHAAGVVHRDLKSGNVFLVASPQGTSPPSTRAVVTDFGLALSTIQASPTLTATGELVGSPAYMAPEQVRGEEATPATDIYALGVVMYEMVTGELPFVGKSAFYTALLRLQQPAPSPRTRAPDLDPAWEAVILCCLEREPAGRFRHARHVVRALGVSLSEETTTGFLPLPPHRPRRKRLRLLWGLGLLASAAVVVGVLVVLVLRSRPGERPLPADPASAAAQAVTPVTPMPTRTAVAVLPFEDLARGPQTAYLRASLFQMLPTELAAASGLRPLPVEEVDRARAELAIPEAANLSAETLSRLRSRLGADLVVSGAYLVTDGGRRARFDVQVQDTRTGDTVTSFREEGSEAEFLAILARVGERLRQGLGQEALTPGEMEALRSLRPASLEAGRFYAEGLERLRASEPAQARDFLLQATGLDPDNPLPHAALADAWSQLRYDLQARVEAKRAHELSGTLPFEGHQLVEARWRETEGDWDGAIRIYRELRARYPDEIEHGLRLAAAQTGGSRPKDALDTLAELRRRSAASAFTGRILLAEAEAAKRLSDHRRQLAGAEAAAAVGRRTGSPTLVADALVLEGDAGLSLGELDRAREALDQAARLYDEAGYRAGAARAVGLRGVVLESQNDLAGAEKDYNEALAVFRSLGYDFGIASNLNNLAILDIRQGRFAEARPKLEQALDIFLRIGRKDAAANALNNLGAIAEAEGDLATYETRLRAALDLYHELGNKAAEAQILLNTGRLSYREGRVAEAARQVEEALSVYRQSGDRAGAARALQDRGDLWLQGGDLAAAGRDLREAWKIQGELGDKGGQAEGSLELASLALEQGDARAAEARAREALALFRAAQLAEREAESLVMLARCRLAAGDTAAARELIARAEPAIRHSENPQLRVFHQIVASRVLAASGQTGKAVERAQAAVRGARDARTVPWELEARLALGEAETRAGIADGPKDLAAVAQDAKAKGFGGIARRAAQALAPAK